RYHDKHKSKKNRDPSRDKENTLNANFPADSYGENRSTSDEEEQSRIRYKKERKELQEFAKQRHHSSSGGSTGIGLDGVDYKLAVNKLNCGSSGRMDRKSSQPVSRAESSAEEGREKKKCRSNSSRKANSSDTDDSDEPKKHSIFDIPDDGPNISMYDKVKARSCKNMQKQEEEKKIKAKFSQLKQCRAKREGKNRSKSWEEGDDSDSDAMHSDTTINSKYNHKDPNKSGMVTTTDDEDHASTTPRSRRNFKDPNKSGMVTTTDDEDHASTTPRSRRNFKGSSLASDSDESHDHSHQQRTAMFNRERLNDLCDDESSEGGGNLMLHSVGGDGRDKLNRDHHRQQKQDYHEKNARRSSGEDK
uniref:Uncharacterized protein n=1 Tax=Anopheles maculatus TaxID=74869 RepID=A0A182SRH0_9DIPT